MRLVNRNIIDAPESLSGKPDSSGQHELARAAKHFASTPNKKFTFAAYKQPDVLDALTALFHGKCAYCESSFVAVAPTDIEHFRPKGRVSECPGHSGYWWLAGTWDNLLPSCIDCNRRRYQPIEQLPNDPLNGGVEGKFNLGKGDSFPIFGQYVLEPGPDVDMETEDAALIDPTRRNPADHLEWIQEQGLSLIGPRLHNDGLDRYGCVTHRILGLNRQGLVEARTTVLRQLERQINDIEDLLDMAVTDSGEVGARLRDKACEMLRNLADYATPDMPYSAMVEDFLHQESERLLEKYQELVV